MIGEAWVLQVQLYPFSVLSIFKKKSPWCLSSEGFEILFMWVMKMKEILFVIEQWYSSLGFCYKYVFVLLQFLFTVT